MAGKKKNEKQKNEKQKSSLMKAAKSAENRNKARKAQPANSEKRKRGSLKEYLKGVRIETKKVVWPTRKELFSYTIIVFVTCTFFGLVIWGVDSAFLAALKQLLGISF